MSIYILHISDLHAGKRIEFFNEKVSQISKKILDLDTNEIILLFSGDLTQGGESQQYSLVSSLENEYSKK